LLSCNSLYSLYSSTHYRVEELEVPATKEDFETAISKIQSSVGAEDIKKYEDWMKEFGSA
jgi:SpoVK/Ycf46/Vps4 family AAA+-type ATPase